MNEEEARPWLIETLNVSRETLAQLDRYFSMVCKQQEKQNLVSAATLSNFWSRHIVDSAQLVPLARPGSWLDIGSGAGVPGIITAILTGELTTLVEPRALRATFLKEAAEMLALTNVTVVQSTVQKLVATAMDTITARAVTALPALIEMAIPFAHKKTIWLLPKGKTAQSELASLPRTWHGHWELCASVTDPDGKILVGSDIRITGKR